MKTFARLIRRYVLAASLITLLIVVVTLGVLAAWGYRYTDPYNKNAYTALAVAEALHAENGAFVFDNAHTPAEWMDGYAWAMVLDDDGSVIWEYALPENLPRHYTAREQAAFVRWFLDDYPVFTWVEDYGLFVIAMPRGSMVRYNVYSYPDTVRNLLHGVVPVLWVLVGLVLLGCLLVSWQSSRSLKQLTAGLDALARGQTAVLPIRGFTAELAEKLNQTSAQLQKRNEIIARRDNARTNWIAGVSHDIRTPLALILGWAEQLEQNDALPADARAKAGGICAQSERIRSLIEDLNLTSKLQYGAQPLRRSPVAVGAFLRRVAADFWEGPLAERGELELDQTPEAARVVLNADEALLRRALENLLSNSVRHNAGPVRIRLRAAVLEDCLRLAVLDDGAGYPPQVLAALYAREEPENAPHILGLHVVEQIAEGHGGRAVFTQAVPQGARAVLILPLHYGGEIQKPKK